MSAGLNDPEYLRKVHKFDVIFPKNHNYRLLIEMQHKDRSYAVCACLMSITHHNLYCVEAAKCHQIS